MGNYGYTDADKAAIAKARDKLNQKFKIWQKNGNGKTLLKDADGKTITDENGKPILFDRDQYAFGKMLYPNWKNPQGQISKLLGDKKDVRIPPDKLDKMIEIFNHDGIPTTKDEFLLQSSEASKYNTQAVNRWIKDHYKIREDIHFLNIDTEYKRLFSFLSYIKQIPKYDEYFPLWTALVISENPEAPYNKLPKKQVQEMWEYSLGADLPIFTRDSYKNLPDTAYSKEYAEFQVDKGKDGIKTIQEADLNFIQEVQLKVEQYIISLFLEHKKELDKEPDHINQTFFKRLSNIAPDRKSMLHLIKDNKELTDMALELADYHQEEYNYDKKEGDDE